MVRGKGLLCSAKEGLWKEGRGLEPVEGMVYDSGRGVVDLPLNPVNGPCVPSGVEREVDVRTPLSESESDRLSFRSESNWTDRGRGDSGRWGGVCRLVPVKRLLCRTRCVTTTTRVRDLVDTTGTN